MRAQNEKTKALQPNETTKKPLPFGLNCKTLARLYTIFSQVLKLRKQDACKVCVHVVVKDLPKDWFH